MIQGRIPILKTLLSVPHALSSGGWFSLILLLVIASSALYTVLLIQRCMDMDPSIRSYPDIGESAFGAKGRALVSIVMNTELYMVATGFLILEGDNLYNLLPDVKFEIGGFKIGGRESVVIMVGLIILPTVWLNNMSILSYISASGVIVSLLLLCSIFWAGEFDGIGFHHKGVLRNWGGIPTNVLGICFLVCTITYALMAIVGYLMFGSELKSQITLNLPINKISSRVAICTTLVNPIAKYALMVIPIVNAIETRLPVNCHKRSYSVFVQTSLVLSTVVVALAIPLFGYLMSLVGAFLSVTTSTILPCLCFLRISGIYQTLGLEQLIIVGIVLMGISIMIVGTYTSVMEIVMHFVT